MEKAGLFVIHPYSNFRFVWDLLTLGKRHLVQMIDLRHHMALKWLQVMLFTNILCIPVFMAFPVFEFDLHKPVHKQHEAYGAMIFRLISGKVQLILYFELPVTTGSTCFHFRALKSWTAKDAWFVIDIALNFRTGIIEENSHNEIIIDARAIRKKYFRGWFFIGNVFNITRSFESGLKWTGHRGKNGRYL